MTYAVHVTVANGEAQVTSQTTDDDAPPDGVYTITGAVSGAIVPGKTAESIGISCNDAAPAGSASGVGPLRASASAYVVR